MAKPIVVMYIPRDDYFGRNAAGDEPAALLMRTLNGNFGEDVKDGMAVYHMPDYWLIFPKDEITEPELQVFYEKNFTPIRFDELKKFIEDSLKKDNDGKI